MNVSINIWSVFIGISALHGFFLTGILLFRNKGYKTSNLWFGLIMLVFSFTLLEYTLLLSGHVRSVVHVFSVNAPFILLLGPFLWFFTRHNLEGGLRLTKRQYLHFLPALLFFASLMPFYLLSSETKMEILDDLYTKGMSIPPSILIMNIVFFGYLAGYFVAAYRRLGAPLQVPARTSARKRVSVMIVVMTIFYTISLVSLIFLVFPSQWRLEVHYVLILLFTLLIYALSYRILFLKEEQQFAQVKYQGRQIDPDHHLKDDLESMLRNQRPFLDPNLKIKVLAEQMNMSTHQLSQLINQSFNTNFSGLINQLRVERAEEILKENPDEKLLAVAIDSGFSNQANFIRVFKQYKGETPSEYRDSHKN